MTKFRHCVLHIGTEKTGTTTLQTVLVKNRDEFLNQGFFIPKSLSRHEHIANHEFLTTVSLADDKFNDDIRISAGVHTPEELAVHRLQVKTNLEDEIRSFKNLPDTVILSNEHLSSRLTSVSEVENLKNFLQLFVDKVTVLVYLRPQYSLAMSAYNQALKAGHFDIDMLPSFGLDSEPARRWTERSYFDYETLLDRWSQVFRPINVVPKLFDSESIINGNTVDDFLAFIGIKQQKIIASERQNEALTRPAQYFLEMINKRSSQMGKALNPEARWGLIQALETLSKFPKKSASKQEIDKFQQQFDLSNENVRVVWFPSRIKLFNDYRDQVDNLTQTLGPSEESFMDIFIHLLEYHYLKQRLS